MILRIAWRNIWRNPVRSLIVIMSLVSGMFAGVFSSAFMYGWMMQRLRAGIETETSHIQLHSEEYMKEENLSSFINFNEKNTSVMEKIGGVKSFSPRILVTGIAGSAEKSVGVKIIGVKPQSDSMVVNVARFVEEGCWLNNTDRNPIVIGQKLAEDLKLKLKSKIILRFQDVQGNITGGVFRLAGIYKTLNSSYDQLNIFVRDNDIQRLTGLPEDACHEIYVRCENVLGIQDVRNQMKKDFPALDIQMWSEISPELGYIQEVMNLYMFVFVIIILIALGFGIVNTMLMVVLERIHELGMLLAVGMQRRQVFMMILAETTMLSGCGGLIGVLFGLFATNLTAEKGIDLSMWSEGLSEMGFASVIYPEYNRTMIVGVVILVLLTGVVSALYPAYKAVRLSVTNALQSI